jgi:hypothetical protein
LIVAPLGGRLPSSPVSTAAIAAAGKPDQDPQ